MILNEIDKIMVRGLVGIIFFFVIVKNLVVKFIQGKDSIKIILDKGLKF